MNRTKSFLAMLLLLVRASWKKFSADNCGQMAAALGYYTLFALVPLIIFTVSVLGVILVSDLVQAKMMAAVTRYLEAGVGDVTFSIKSEAAADLEAQYGASAVDALESELEELNNDPEREEERQQLAVALARGETVTLAGLQLDSDDLEFRLNGVIADAVRSYAEARSGVSSKSSSIWRCSSAQACCCSPRLLLLGSSPTFAGR